MPGFLAAADLHQHYAHADPDRVDALVAELRRRGMPLWDTDSDRVTFVRHVPGAPEDAGVHVQINRLTDKQLYSRGLMDRIPGTDLWVLTLHVAPTARISYGFTEFTGDAPTTSPRPGHHRVATLSDPLNPRPPVGPAGSSGVSVLVGPLAPAQDEWDQPREPEGTLLSESGVETPLGPRPAWLYLPDGVDPAEELPVLLIFDAEVWRDIHPLPQALDRAVASGRQRPMAILGVPMIDHADRMAHLGGHERFLDAVAGPLCRWAEDLAVSQGRCLAGPDQRVVAGQSLGGTAALVLLLRHPESVGAVISQSPSLWWEPDAAVSPASLGERQRDWLTSRFDRISPPSARVLLSVGTLETASVAHVAELHVLLSSRGVRSEFTAVTGGHDFLWWRGELLRSLAELFPPVSGV